MIAVLDGTAQSLKAVLAAAPATTQPTYHLVQSGGNGAPKDFTGLLTGTTALALLSGEASVPPKVVNSLTVHNSDTAAVTLTLQKTAGGSTYQLTKVTLPSLATFVWDAAGQRVLDSSGQILQSINTSTTASGTAANGAVASESGTIVRKTVLTLDDVSVTVGNTTGVSFGGTKIYDFPAGRILILGVTIDDVTFDLTDAGNVTPIAGTHGGDIAIGTTAPTDGTLTNEDVNLLPSTSIDPISGGVGGAALAASAQIDGTTTALDAFFNILIDDADVADGASDVLLVNGTVTIHWINLGDY